jgi:hypothetical protein
VSAATQAFPSVVFVPKGCVSIEAILIEDGVAMEVDLVVRFKGEWYQHCARARSAFELLRCSNHSEREHIILASNAETPTPSREE